MRRTSSHASCKALRRHLLCAAAVSIVATAPVVAAEQAGADVDETVYDESDIGDDSGAIVVSGTRLKDSSFESPTPITSLGSEMFDMRASTNVADTLNELPAFRPSSTPSSSTQSINNVANLADLRGLGANRTLVLVNGRRVVASNISGNVDLDLVPVSLIGRTDVVTGGASAAYGSDAVAGVVNLVLKQIDGLSGEVQYGLSERGDNRSYKGSLAFGTPIADGRGHLSIAGEYADARGVRRQDSRDWYTESGVLTNAAYTSTNGEPQRLIAENVHFAAATYNGLINSGALKGTEFLADGTTRDFNYGTSVGSYMIGGDGVNVGAMRPLSYPVRSNSIFLHSEFDASDVLRLSAELSWAHKKAGGPSFAYPYTRLTFYADNPYLPESVQTALADAGETSFTMGKFVRDLGVFNGRNTNDTYRGLLAVDGDIDSNWSWNAYYQYGQTRTLYRTTGRQISANLTKAMDAVIDTDTGDIVCRSTLTTPNDGCVPVNMFGDGAPSAAAIAYINGEGGTANEKIQQHVAALGLSGDLFETWAGPVPVAIGGEYRKERLNRTADAISAASGFNVANILPMRGSIEVKEAFAEFALPLATDAPFAENLELNGAVRLTDYSTSGTVTTWKLGGNYAPSSDIRFRATLSRDIRAPNFNELYLPTVTNFFTATDPTRENAQTFSQQLTTGNTDLKPEISDMFTGGVVLTPDFIPGLKLSADYYDIRIKDAIATITAQQTIDRCYAGNALLCPLITRDGEGVISSVRISYLNLASVKTNGVDLAAEYALPLGGNSDGRLTFSALASYIHKLTLNDGVTVTEQGGVVGTDYGSSPHWRATGSVTYASELLTAFLQGRWIGGGIYNPAFDGNAINDNTVDGQFLVNAAVKIMPMSDRPEFGLTFSVSNLFDADPPVDPSTFIYAAQTNQVLYDVFGRSFKVGASFSF